MTNKEAIELLKKMPIVHAGYKEVIDIAIEALNCSEMPNNSDCISRQMAIDALAKFVPYAICDASTESYTNGLTDAYNLICQLPSAQPEPCEDAVSRQRLLSDLKELTAAWGKYPVMEEQIKGVETAIGYVETIPSAQPEQRWIPCSERLPEEEYVLISKKPKKYFDGGRCVTVAIRMEDPRSRKVNWRDIGFGVIPDDNVFAWMPLPEPYQGREQDD